jgi:hypothetical protein
MTQPKIITFTNLLHKHRNVEHEKVQAFLNKNAQDKVFSKRAAVLIRVWKLKQGLLGD